VTDCTFNAFQFKLKVAEDTYGDEARVKVGGCSGGGGGGEEGKAAAEGGAGRGGDKVVWVCMWV
jgi:hypothetical protein